MANTSELIISEEYGDFILPYSPDFLQEYREEGGQLFDSFYGMIHLPLQNTSITEYLNEFGYSAIPKLFTLLDTVSLEESGIIKTQTQPVLNLKGSGVIIGFVDTGINYMHPSFIDEFGKTRILSIWDQSIQSGSPPDGQMYGTEYSRALIQEALDSDTPELLVPSTDTNGHGTFIAGVAAGSPDPAQNFTGAAPQADIIMVKLKEAKQYLKNFFYANASDPIYQETDIMFAVQYLRQCAVRFNKALVICVGLGTNQGAHNGQFPLGNMLNRFDTVPAIHIVTAAGNEAGRAHHFYGNPSREEDFDTVEILVPENTEGFTAELWSIAPDTYSVGFTSPLGETISRIPSRLQNQQEIDFILENTRIFIRSESVFSFSSFQLIFLRFANPTPGVWKIHVYGNNTFLNIYHMWLPISGMNINDITFLTPNPDTTITDPANASNVITSSAYNAYNNSLYLNSSRGYTSLGYIKPDFSSPGVNVFGPGRNNTYTRRTGSSISAAIAAGAVALLTEWGLNKNPRRIFTTTEIKSLLLRGAARTSDRLYPNREWGYGTLNVYEIFTSFFENE